MKSLQNATARKKATTLLIAASLGVTCVLGSSCASPEKRTAIGAGTGAGAGAIIGGIAGGWKGAAIGAAVGGVTGGAVGNMLDKQAQELEKVAETERTAQGILVKLKGDLLFDTGSSTLKPQAVEQLTQLGDILAKYPKDQVKVSGYTDNVGKEGFNEDLSQRRAKSVAEVLKDRGVTPKQIMALGLGESNPIAPNSTDQGRALNRRVELTITVPETKKG